MKHGKKEEAINHDILIIDFSLLLCLNMERCHAWCAGPSLWHSISDYVIFLLAVSNEIIH